MYTGTNTKNWSSKERKNLSLRITKSSKVIIIIIVFGRNFVQFSLNIVLEIKRLTSSSFPLPPFSLSLLSIQSMFFYKITLTCIRWVCAKMSARNHSNASARIKDSIGLCGTVAFYFFLFFFSSHSFNSPSYVPFSCDKMYQIDFSHFHFQNDVYTHAISFFHRHYFCCCCWQTMASSK